VAHTAVETARTAFSKDPSHLPELVTSLEVYGDIKRQLGEVSEAEALYVEALEVDGKEDIPVEQQGRIRGHLAVLYDLNQLEDDAVPFYEEAILLLKEVDPAPKSEIAHLRNNVAMIYKHRDDHEAAEGHYLEALRLLEDIHGKEHDEVASVYNNLGSLYQSAGFTDQALEIQLEALEIRLKILPEHDSDIAQSYCNLASVYHELGEFENAVKYYEKGLHIYELILDLAISEDYMIASSNYSKLLADHGKERKAQALEKRVHKHLKHLKRS
jgi:tetratricopeptide (TPR) repeat protein